MPNYQNGKIYRINGNGLTYIGSTVEPLNRRINKHRSIINCGIYCSSRKVINGTETIELIENFPCNNRQELLERECYWFNQIPNCNDLSPVRKPINKHEEYIKWKTNNPESYKKQVIRMRSYRLNKKMNGAPSIETNTETNTNT